jgi:hypothetical protein
MAANTIPRISPQKTNEHLQSEPAALLVCAYESETKFERNQLEGAISLHEFREREDTEPKGREIIFYCA